MISCHFIGARLLHFLMAYYCRCARIYMPPVTDAYRRVLDANGFTDEPPTYETVYSKELLCDLKAW